MNTRILSIITATVLSGCAGSSTQPASGMQTLLPGHHPQVTFTVDTVRTDTTASNPVCLPEKYGNLLHERHPDLFAGDKNVVFRGAFFDGSLTPSGNTLRRIVQQTPCVESLKTSAGPEAFTADISPGVGIQITPDIQGTTGNITLRLSATDQKRKQTVEQRISLRPEQSLVVNEFTGDDTGEKRVVLITPHVR
ncbi:MULTISPECIES: hypothetical protein [Enterobacteriaceae]|uniref:hypothetical protein n=1 Tax=Enterobacteriaceae TaxID=543 RepID=UPI000F5CBAEE|nr:MULTISPECIES: hypothetical protein [Enterobacteriaceae]MBJ3400323.1 hypothetical protein [Salmonella enterica subsp. enterica serovar Typhimurium]MBJ4119063.1 hypothetical protein [Salmonella enterica subsp. enterica serovar Indiana]MBJ4519630.1 hypothetical protein [Salmonella enterica subsp. enterica serovar Agona]MCL9171444.1 hypothetical protein [Salmonella enterica subsp. enterica serovar Enteritidis]ECD6375831.1 hypothetical protein [Salmonella enterica subsp. enterica serovar Kentuck